MTQLNTLFFDIKASKIALRLLIVIHALAVLSILSISDIGEVGLPLKTSLFILVVVSWNKYSSYYKNNIHLSLKSDGLVDFNIGDKEYYDFQLASDSYVSDVLLQLILSNSITDVSRTVTLFPDSINIASHSRLRAWLKINSKYKDLASL
ncbi:MAG: hypothetical protein OEY06_05660 [Gammaproteobacteria bacterium]|nr:hypothetical protein [Gammaproteobacteria bacterium]